MKVMRFVAGIVGLLVVIPVIAVGIFLATFDANAFKKDIMAQVSEKLGRQVTIDGAVKIDFTDGLSVNLKEVKVASPNGFAEKDFASVGDLYVFINWQALLNRAIEVKKLTLSDARFVLQTNAAGRNNWDLAPQKEAAVKEVVVKDNAEKSDNIVEATKKELGKAVEERKSDFQIERVELSSIEIKNTSIVQIAADGKKQEVVIETATFKIPVSGPFSAMAKGAYNTTPFAVDLEAERGINDLISGNATPIDLKADYAGQSYAARGLLARSEKDINLTNLEARLMGSEWTGNLHVETGGAKPAINGSLTTGKFDLTSMAKPAQKAQAEGMPKPKATLIAAEVAPAPDLQVLNTLNADLKLAIGELVATPDLTLNKLATVVKIADGRLLLNDLSFTLLDTPYKGLVEVDGRNRTPSVRVVMDAANVDLPLLAQKFKSKLPVSSRGDISADLRMNGLTPESMMASLGGKLEIALGEGTFDMGGADETAVNLVKFLFPQGAVQQKPNISCAALRFNAANGVLTTNGLVLESNFATVGGEGTIDLGGQNVDLLLRPVPKESKTASLIATPVRVSGPMAKPGFAPQQDALFQKVSGILRGSSGPVSTGVPQVKPVANGNACIAALNNPQPIMVTPPSAKEVLKDNVQQVKDRINQGKDSIKSLKDMFNGKGATNNGTAPATEGQQPAAQDTINKLKGLLGR